MPRIQRKLGVALGAAALAGCSLLLDQNADQCKTDADCAALGAAFAGRVCLSGVCQRPTTTTDAGKDSGADAVAEASTDGSGDAITGGCTTSAQCTIDNGGREAFCPSPGASCIPLVTNECPLLLGPWSDPNVILVGAFSNVPPSAPRSDRVTLAFDLGVSEFDAFDLPPAYPGGPRRPLAALVCKPDDTTTIEAGARHLVDDVGVQAILGTLPSDTLRSTFETILFPKRVFFLNAGAYESSFSLLQTEGLLWSMVGDIRDTAPAYGPLIERVERLVRDRRDAGTTDLKLALVTANDTLSSSFSSALLNTIRYNNGKTVSQNGSNFLPLQVQSASAGPVDASAQVAAILAAPRPQIIVSAAGAEFLDKVWPGVELGWPQSEPRPFYVLSPLNAGDPRYGTLVSSNSGDLASAKRARSLGVNFASNEDTGNYDQFIIRIRQANPEFLDYVGYENYYDGFYFLAYAIAASGSASRPTGADIGKGMKKLLQGARINIGPSEIPTAFGTLSSAQEMRFFGALGPPSFDVGTNARKESGSVYCIAPDNNFAYDVLRASTDGGAVTLVGDGGPCAPGL